MRKSRRNQKRLPSTVATQSTPIRELSQIPQRVDTPSEQVWHDSKTIMSSTMHELERRRLSARSNGIPCTRTNMSSARWIKACSCSSQNAKGMLNWWVWRFRTDEESYVSMYSSGAFRVWLKYVQPDCIIISPGQQFMTAEKAPFCIRTSAPASTITIQRQLAAR
uniref:Uncharacterized protein n=1 Tax=Spironucleus salmonicida TaxID=348837 RepID=V6LRB4_9EUKA|eukprot:EST46793.1 Hypothetical protein SS50377_13193 [Spironucleus salmonicida]